MNPAAKVLVRDVELRGSNLKEDTMRQLQQIEDDILNHGRVDSHELEELRGRLYATGTVDRAGADFLVGLHKRIANPTLAFEQFFYRAIKDHILTGGRIDAEEAAWLRRLLLDDGPLNCAGRRLLHELKDEADRVSLEFVMLFTASMKTPSSQAPCG